MKFKMTIDINMDNAAFKEDHLELESIVREFTRNTFFPHFEYAERVPLKDANGNTVGYAAMEVTE